ncbi:HMA domain-containing protein [Psidium guajava]|nr:HMA domain-containing protein [Psidium guajava]
MVAQIHPANVDELSEENQKYLQQITRSMQMSDRERGRRQRPDQLYEARWLVTVRYI